MTTSVPLSRFSVHAGFVARFLACPVVGAPSLALDNTSLALDYEKHEPGSALPWDQARRASRAAWTKVSGVTTPRDVTRGTRDSI